MKFRFLFRLRKLLKYFIPLGFYLWWNRKRNPDKYVILWEQESKKVILFDSKIFGIWYTRRKDGRFPKEKELDSLD